MADDLPQEFIDTIMNSDPTGEDDPVADFIKMKQMRDNAPVGSAQETINQRFPKLNWSGDEGTMMPAMNIEADPDDVAYSGMDTVGLQHYWRNLPAMTNEAGAAAWMTDRSGPYSQNIEDRRNAPVADEIRGAMQYLADDLSTLTPQEYINQVIGGMEHNDFYYGPGTENYHLVHEGMAPRNFDQADFYPTRKVSR